MKSMEERPLSEMEGSPTLPWTVKRITDEGARDEDLQIVLEEPLAVELNGVQVAVMMRLPGAEKELAVGYCVSEGLVAGAADIQMVHHCGRGLPAPGQEEGELAMTSRNRVQVRARPEAVQRRGASEVTRLIRSGCGAVGVELGDLDLPVIASEARASAAVILTLNAAMRGGQDLFRDVGAVHAAALFDLQGNLVALYEDIGRHNAMDKAFGHCLLRGIPLQDKIIATTGRASYEMVSKAARVGLPIVASVSSPTSLAAQVAEAQRCTLIGYMRGNRFSVYTHGWRISS